MMDVDAMRNSMYHIIYQRIKFPINGICYIQQACVTTDLKIAYTAWSWDAFSLKLYLSAVSPGLSAG